jgi:hypothetical protein
MSSPMTAICAFKTFERRLESTYCGRSGPRAWMPHLGGERVYMSRLGNDRNRPDTGLPSGEIQNVRLTEKWRAGLVARAG